MHVKCECVEDLKQRGWMGLIVKLFFFGFGFSLEVLFCDGGGGGGFIVRREGKGRVCGFVSFLLLLLLFVLERI